MPRTGNKDGFALVELVMEAVSITGIVTMLAAMGVQSTIAATNTSASREQAHLSALRTDLQNLAAYQALEYADEAHYAPSVDDLPFNPSEGVKISLVASNGGWAATATHAALPDATGCAVFYGSARVPSEVLSPSAPGQIVCTE